ncbi:hypothetical protein HMJ29_08425 [Hymenobacter taeanensis]|uniref:Lipoprotein n=1 Tax=Hymenobacter taeanensis TaxID=2735321 RepID=A0A6M6BFC4_9BACT|nr:MULTISPECIES: hypothetical protein [Hymenobacter]QJX46956.1 hypothetical protein HMJ29_08425 [Hymenobacter taeanensis]UOQ80835.1 hypothetical protein MUN83_18790 [Hymenobacter sp. 5414T-23]
MVRSTLSLFTGLVLAGSLLTFTSCDKSNDPTDSVATVSAEDQSVAEDENAALGDIVEAASPADVTEASSPATESSDLVRLAGSCFTRTYNAATRTLTLDFGPTNCVGPNGVARRGKVVAVFAGPYRQAGASVTISLVDYYRNDNLHTGTRTITNLGNGSWALSVQNASVTTTAGTHTWSSQRQYTRTTGGATRTILDDTYSVTGQASGTNRKGISYTATIEQPLIKEFRLGCARTFVAGTVRLINAKEQTLLLNYDPTGTQACDNIASVTINGKTHLIRCGR